MTRVESGPVQRPEGLREQIKKETKRCHDRIEATPLAQVLACGSVGNAAYAAYLLGLAGIHTDIEEAASGFGEWSDYGITIAEHFRLPLLMDDLEALGSRPRQEEGADSVGRAWDFPTAVGAMYVLEGSTMGGQILAKRLMHVRGPSGAEATAYFQGHREMAMPRWQKFAMFLDAYGQQHPDAAGRVIEGAKQTYARIEQLMRDIGDRHGIPAGEAAR